MGALGYVNDAAWCGLHGKGSAAAFDLDADSGSIVRVARHHQRYFDTPTHEPDTWARAMVGNPTNHPFHVCPVGSLAVKGGSLMPIIPCCPSTCRCFFAAGCH